jgi:hypothetical protein
VTAFTVSDELVRHLLFLIPRKTLRPRMADRLESKAYDGLFVAISRSPFPADRRDTGLSMATGGSFVDVGNNSVMPRTRGIATPANTLSEAPCVGRILRPHDGKTTDYQALVMAVDAMVSVLEEGSPVRLVEIEVPDRAARGQVTASGDSDV